MPMLQGWAKAINTHSACPAKLQGQANIPGRSKRKNPVDLALLNGELGSALNLLIVIFVVTLHALPLPKRVGIHVNQWPNLPVKD